MGLWKKAKERLAAKIFLKVPSSHPLLDLSFLSSEFKLEQFQPFPCNFNKCQFLLPSGLNGSGLPLKFRMKMKSSIGKKEIYSAL